MVRIDVWWGVKKWCWVANEKLSGIVSMSSLHFLTVMVAERQLQGLAVLDGPRLATVAWRDGGFHSSELEIAIIVTFSTISLLPAVGMSLDFSVSQLCWSDLIR